MNTYNPNKISHQNNRNFGTDVTYLCNSCWYIYKNGYLSYLFLF